MRRRDFITALGGAATWPLAARAQQGERMRRIGVLMASAADDPEFAGPHGGVSAGAAAIGLDRRPQRADRHALGAGRCRRPSQIRGGIGRARAGRHPGRYRHRDRGAVAEATRTVPIVFVIVTDPVGAGFVESLARPGGNATGFSMFEYGLSGKWLELLKQIAPGVTRAAVLRDPAIASGIGQFAAIQAVAPSLGVELSPVNVRDAPEIERAVTAFARSGNGGLIVTASAVTLRSSRSDHHAGGPASSARGLLPHRHYVAAGGLISYRSRFRSTSTAARPATSIASSRAKNRPTCRCRRRPSTSWSSTSRPPRRSASTCRRCCSRVPTR